MRKLAPSEDDSIYQGGAWPTDAQQLLLQAALLDAPAAVDAWEAWQEQAKIDALDSGSWRLLPLVYVNLKRLGVTDPLLFQAKECHRYQWICNQKLFHQAAGFLEELEQLETPALVLKGVALAHLYYPDTGARPMADLDLLVPEQKFLALGNHLLRNGWKETDGLSFDPFETNPLPSFGFVRPDGFWVDIHHHVLHANCARSADDAFWSHARPWIFRQKSVRTLSPEDHLLHVISHGLRWCDVPPFRWVADAWWILARSKGAFDWERFCRQARFHTVHLTIFRGLEFMSQVIPLDLPAGLLTRLERIPISPKARIRFIADTHPLPRNFFWRVRCIWEAMGTAESGYSIVGIPPAPRTGRFALRSFWSVPWLLLYGLKVAVRETLRFLGIKLRF